jgi:hypothetical protein
VSERFTGEVAGRQRVRKVDVTASGYRKATAFSGNRAFSINMNIDAPRGQFTTPKQWWFGPRLIQAGAAKVKYDTRTGMPEFAIHCVTSFIALV